MRVHLLRTKSYNITMQTKLKYLIAEKTRTCIDMHDKMLLSSLCFFICSMLFYALKDGAFCLCIIENMFYLKKCTNTATYSKRINEHKCIKYIKIFV